MYCQIKKYVVYCNKPSETTNNSVSSSSNTSGTTSNSTSNSSSTSGTTSSITVS